MSNINLNYQGNKFTILEITFVLLVAGIVGLASYPYFSSTMESSYRVTCESNLLAIGMALEAYSTDFDLYPASEDVVSDLSKNNYLKSGIELRCPLDKSEIGKTYSLGYLGGHPSSIQNDDPLVVCGHHPRVGTLAVFADVTVGALGSLNSDDAEVVPLTIKHSGDDVGPGFIFHNSEAVVIESEDGNHVSVYGEGESYFISASYDPTAYNGDGLFTIAIGLPADIGNDAFAWADGSSYIEFQTNIANANVKLTGSPSETNSTKISYTTIITTSLIWFEHYHSYELTHISTGHHFESSTAASSVQYEVLDTGISLYSLEDNFY